MKILLVDDDENRVRKIRDYVSAHLHGASTVVLVSETAQQARDVLREEQVDLLVLDILIPNRLGDEPKATTSLNLLIEITEFDRLNKPRKVVGLTADSDAMSTAYAAFVEQTWTVILANEIGDGWLKAILNCIEYLGAQREQEREERYELDVLIVAALREPEMRAVRALDFDWLPEEPFDDNTFISKGRILSKGRSLSVASAYPDRMGMVSAAILTTQLIKAFRPRICVMPGICAGIKDRAEIGDVLFADICWDYQSGKMFVDAAGSRRFDIDPHQIGVDSCLSARVENLAGDSAYLHTIWSEWPDRPSNPPRLLRGPVASGSAVLADERSVAWIAQQQRKVRGIEMELYGFYLAGHRSPRPKPMTFGLKAVCDFADGGKDDRYQNYAAYTSARVVGEFLQRFGSDLVDIVDRH